MSEMEYIEVDQDGEILSLTTEIVSAFASRNQFPMGDLSDLIRQVHATLSSLANGSESPVAEVEEETVLTPAVPIDTSVKKDAIACLECGKTFKTLKRHLSTEHGLSPADYKARWQLSKDYPLVAPSYSKRRAETAKKIGLGRKPKA